MWGPRGWTRSAIGLTQCTTDLFSVNKPRGSQSDFGLIGLDSIKEVSMLLCIPSFCLVFEQFSHLSKRCANESQELNVNPTLHCAVFSVSWAFWPVLLSWSVSSQVCKSHCYSFLFQMRWELQTASLWKRIDYKMQRSCTPGSWTFHLIWKYHLCRNNVLSWPSLSFHVTSHGFMYQTQV